MNEDDIRDVEPLDEVLAGAVSGLTREAEPDPFLEEQTVRLLREHGRLRARSAARPLLWWAAGLAASIALFASGVVAGQWLGTRHTAAAVAAQQKVSLVEMATVLEQTGGEYVRALSRLAESDVYGGGPNERAREIALQMLHQAANEVVRLAPNDPVAVKILQGFDHAAVRATAGEGRATRRQIIWF